MKKTNFFLVGTVLSPPMMNRLSLTKIYLIFGGTIVATLLAVSFIRNYYAFLLLYMFGFGISVGLLYIIPLAVIYAYFPNNRGSAGGVLVAGFTIGTFCFDMISEKIINPENLKLDDLKEENIMSPDALPERASIFFWVLAGFFFLTTALAIIFVQKPAERNQSPLLKRPKKEEVHRNVLSGDDQSDESNLPAKRQKKEVVGEINKNLLSRDEQSGNETQGATTMMEPKPVINKQEKNVCPSIRVAMRSKVLYQLILIPFFQACN